MLHLRVKGKMDAHLVRTAGQAVFDESEGRDQKRQQCGLSDAAGTLESLLKGWVMLVGGYHGSGAHQPSAVAHVGEALSTGFPGRCCEPQPLKKRRSEKAEAVGFEVDAETSVVLLET